jgi:maltokinase
VTGDVGQRLRSHATTLRRRIAPLRTPPRATPLLRLHGDLHVGQVLTVGDRVYLTDLDGDPSAQPGEPARPGPAARDLAALLRSLDHVGRLAARRGPPVDAAAVDRWVAQARATCRQAYVETLERAGRRELLADGLVDAFEAAQLSHELLYSVRRLPEWLPVAQDAFEAFVEGRVPRAA